MQRTGPHPRPHLQAASDLSLGLQVRKEKHRCHEFDTTSSPNAVKLIVGSPGGSQIINFVAKALVGVLDWQLEVQAAIDLPNFGSRNGPTQLERGSRYEALAPALTERGHDIRLSEMESGLHGIERTPGGWRGGADPRREGVVLGR